MCASSTTPCRTNYYSLIVKSLWGHFHCKEILPCSSSLELGLLVETVFVMLYKKYCALARRPLPAVIGMFVKTSTRPSHWCRAFRSLLSVHRTVVVPYLFVQDSSIMFHLFPTFTVFGISNMLSNSCILLKHLIENELGCFKQNDSVGEKKHLLWILSLYFNHRKPLSLMDDLSILEDYFKA